MSHKIIKKDAKELVRRTDLIIKPRKKVRLASMYNMWELLKYYLAKYGDGYYSTAFYRTCKFGHLENAKQLVKLYGNTFDDDNYNNAFSAACGCGFLEVADWLCDIVPINGSYENYYALYRSCKRGQLRSVKYLFDKNGFTPDDLNNFIVEAVIKGHVHIVRYLQSQNGPTKKIKYKTVIDKIIDIIDEDDIEMYEKAFKYLIEAHPGVEDNFLEKFTAEYTNKNYSVASALIPFIEHRADMVMAIKVCCKVDHQQEAIELFQKNKFTEPNIDSMFKTACRNERYGIMKAIYNNEKFDIRRHENIVQWAIGNSNIKLYNWLNMHNATATIDFEYDSY